MKERIAIIGSGISGLTAGYLLNDRYDLTLFEKKDRIGGNAYTHTTSDGAAADIGVMSFHRKYRSLFRLFDRLGVETVSGVGSMGGALCDLDSGEGLYISPHLRGLIAQRFGILRPDRLLSNLALPFGLKQACRLLNRGEMEGLTLEQGLAKVPLIRGDGKLAFLGTLCMMSSMHCDELLDTPASFYFGKLKHYGDLFPPKVLFGIRFMKNQTRSYINGLAAPFQDRIKLNAQIRQVRRTDQGVTIGMNDGTDLTFDKVVFACHADQALKLLADPTMKEQQALGPWTYTRSEIIVHRDLSAFPARDLLDGYTMMYRKNERYMSTSVTFSLWILPGVPRTSDWVITQHGNFPIKEELVDHREYFYTPNFNFEAVAAQPRVMDMNGENSTFYCGSHFGYGLHEDAINSAISVADRLGVPF